MSMNRVVLVGRLTKDPALRYTPNGIAVTNFTVASNRPYKSQDGEQQAGFVNCVIWRKPAESLANFMKKGSLVGVDGRLQTRTYEGQDGKTVFVTEVLAENVQFLEPRNSAKRRQKQNQEQNQGNNQNQCNYQNQNHSNYQNQNQENYQNQQQNNQFQQQQGQNQPLDISDDDL